MTITITDIIAFIGAGAWFPQIVTFFLYLFRRPKLIAIVHENSSLYFTNSGPLLSLDLALLSKNGDFLIENLYIDITHSNGFTIKFHWIWQEESLGNMQIPQLGSVPFNKCRKIVAINCIKDSIEERSLSFYDTDFKAKYDKIEMILNTQKYQNKRDGINLEKLKETMHYQDLKTLFRSKKDIPAGKYNLKLYYTKRNKEKVLCERSFTLTQANTESYSSNIPIIDEWQEELFVKDNNQEFPAINVIFFNLSDRN